MSDVLRAGVIGVGYLGGFHAEKYAAMEGVDLVGVYDVDRARAEEVASKTASRVFSDVSVLLDGVDLVSIAVPTEAHLSIGLAAADAGVPMLVEKPLAASAEAGRELAAAAAAAKVMLQVGHLERFNPVLEEVHKVVAHPRFIECHRLSPFAGRGGDTNVVHDVMIHDLDLIAYLVGRPLAGVDAVGVSVLSDHVDIANARLRFEGGAVANVTASRVSLKRERKLRVFQDDGYVAIDFDARRLVVATHDRAKAVQASPMEAIHVEEREFEGADPLRAEIQAFVQCVRDGTAPLVGAAEGLIALDMAEAVLASLESHEGD